MASEAPVKDAAGADGQLDEALADVRPLVMEYQEAVALFLQDYFKPDSVNKFIRAADESSDVTLCKAAEYFVICKAEEVLAASGFDYLPVAALQRILQRQDFVISEIELFNFTLRWAQTEVKLTKGLEGDAAKEAVRDVIRPVISHIRFPLMTAAELADVVKPAGVLDEYELLWLTAYNTTGKEPPEGLPFIKHPRSGQILFKWGAKAPTLSSNGALLEKIAGGESRASAIIDCDLQPGYCYTLGVRIERFTENGSFATVIGATTKPEDTSLTNYVAYAEDREAWGFAVCVTEAGMAPYGRRVVKGNLSQQLAAKFEEGTMVTFIADLREAPIVKYTFMIDGKVLEDCKDVEGRLPKSPWPQLNLAVSLGYEGTSVIVKQFEKSV